MLRTAESASVYYRAVLMGDQQLHRQYAPTYDLPPSAHILRRCRPILPSIHRLRDGAVHQIREIKFFILPTGVLEFEDKISRLIGFKIKISYPCFICDK